MIKFWVRGPSRGPDSFNFMQFCGKIGKIVCWRPSGGLAPPPFRKSWIHHCKLKTYWFSVRSHNHYAKESTVSGRHRKAFSNIQSWFTDSSLIHLISLIKLIEYKIRKARMLGIVGLNWFWLILWRCYASENNQNPDGIPALWSSGNSGDLVPWDNMLFAHIRGCVVMYPAGRAMNSYWSVNSFIMAIYETFLKFSKNFLSKPRPKLLS